MATTIAHGALMQAAFFLGPNQMELREAPVPVPGLGEVLLKVNACAVCGVPNQTISRNNPMFPWDSESGRDSFLQANSHC